MVNGRGQNSRISFLIGATPAHACTRLPYPALLPQPRRFRHRMLLPTESVILVIVLILDLDHPSSCQWPQPSPSAAPLTHPHPRLTLTAAKPTPKLNPNLYKKIKGD